MNTLFGRDERAKNATNAFIIISHIVDHLRNGILLPILSDRAHNNGEVMNTKIVAKEKHQPYTISGSLLSSITHCAKYIAPIATKKKEFQKS